MPFQKPKKKKIQQTKQTSMTQKIIIVTGANKGIGLETVRDLAISNKDALIIGTARFQDLANSAIADLKEHNGITNVAFEILDLKNSHSIEHFARLINSKYQHIDVLVNNAAIAPPSPIITQQTIDDTLQTNVYGLINLTEKLLPLLKKSKDPRVVNVGSRVGNLEPFSKILQEQFLSAKTTRAVFELTYAYEAAAKHGDAARLGYVSIYQLANLSYVASKSIVHAYTSVLALEHPEILSTSYCPGPIDTDLSRAVDMKKYMKVFTASEGAETGVWLVNSEKKGLENGGFYAEKQIRSKINAPSR